MLLMCFCLSSLAGQVTLGYNYSNVGKNARLGCEFKLAPNLFVEPGLKYIIWTEVKDNRGYAFKDRFRPINFIEHFGLFLSLKYEFIKTKNFNLRVLYNGAVTNSHLITDELLYYNNTVYNSNGIPIEDDLYHRVFQVRPKTFAFENYVCAELNFNMSDKFDFFGQAGLGYVFYHIQDDPNFITPEPNAGEHSWFSYSLGIRYYFKK